MEKQNKQRLEEIKAYLEKMSPAPWTWRKCYEMGNREKHWALENAESRAYGRIINTKLISLDCWTNREEWQQDPDVTGIAALRSDAEWLLSLCLEQQQEIERLKGELTQ